MKKHLINIAKASYLAILILVLVGSVHILVFDLGFTPAVETTLLTAYMVSCVINSISTAILSSGKTTTRGFFPIQLFLFIFTCLPFFWYSEFGFVLGPILLITSGLILNQPAVRNQNCQSDH